MAGDWIKLRTNLWTDPRVAALCEKTGASCAQIVGACAIVWSLADTHSDDGCLWGYSASRIDSLVDLPGFCEAMSKLNYKGKSSPWMELGDGMVRLVDYKKHNGKTAKKRAQTALRASRLRSAGSATNRAPREEKRREEKKREIPPPPPTHPQTCPHPAAADGENARRHSPEMQALCVERGIQAADEIAVSGLPIDAVRDLCDAAEVCNLGPGWVVSEVRRMRDSGGGPRLPKEYTAKKAEAARLRELDRQVAAKREKQGAML